MANLIEYIQSQIYENSTEDISGSIMQQVLTRMASDEGVVNVHTISGQTPFADYNNAQAARDAVPDGFKKLGLIITYKLSSGWYIDEFIGSATSGWSTASNWKCLGPISVSQNASTGKTTITIGSESFDVATQPVSVSQITETGQDALFIGDSPALIIDDELTTGSENLVKSGVVAFHINRIDATRNVSSKTITNEIYNELDISNGDYILKVNNVSVPINVGLYSDMGQSYITQNLSDNLGIGTFYFSITIGDNDNYLRLATLDNAAAVGVEFVIYHNLKNAINVQDEISDVLNLQIDNIQKSLPYSEASIGGYSFVNGYLNPTKFTPSTETTSSKYSSFIPVSKLKEYRLVTKINSIYDSAVWFLRTDEFSEDSYIGQDGYVGPDHQGGDININKVITIPNECNYIVFGSRDYENAALYERELKDTNAILNGLAEKNNVQDNVGSVLNEQIENVQVKMPYTESEVDNYNFTTGYLNPSSYTPVTAGTSSKITGFIPVTKLKTYRLVTKINTIYDCGVWFLRTNAFGQESFISEAYYTGPVPGAGDKNLNVILSIPNECNYIVFGSRDYENAHLYQREIEDAASKSSLEEVEAEVQSLPDIPEWAQQPIKPSYTADEVGAVNKYQGAVNAGKQLFVGNDGSVVLGTEPAPLSEHQEVIEERLKTLYLGQNLIDNNTPVTLGTGWSGTIENGLVVAQGSSNTETLIDYNTVMGNMYIISFNCDFARFDRIFLLVGDSPKVDIYNGETGVRSIGFRSPGGVIKIYVKYADQSITFTNIKCQQVVSEDDAVETLTLNVSNITTGHSPYSLDAYWNVAIGPNGTQSNIQNGTRNIAIGYLAQNKIVSGTRNVGIGTFSMYQLISGDSNIAIGADSLWQTEWAEKCVSIGHASLGAMNTENGSPAYSHLKSMVAVGHAAMGGNPIEAEQSVGIGESAGYRGVSHNVSVGFEANQYLTGEHNTVIGCKAGDTPNVDGEKNTLIGAQADCYNGQPTYQTPKTVNNVIAIGYGVKAVRSNQVVIGNDKNDDFIIGNKRLIFNNDKSVTWEEIVCIKGVYYQYTAIPTLSGSYKLNIVCESSVTLNVTLNTSMSQTSATTTIVNAENLSAGKHSYNVTFNGEDYLRVALINNNIPEGVTFEIIEL